MRRGALVVLAMAIVVALGACTTSGGKDDDGLPVTTTTDGTAHDQQFLTGLAIGPDDVRDGEFPKMIAGGDEVDGQVTLDFCGATFDSEGHRIARHQEAIYDDASEYVAGSEVVRYEPGYAERALDELRDAISSCDPDELSDSSVGGVPDLRIRSTPIDEARLPDVAGDHVAIVAIATDEDGAEMQVVLILQRRGDVLVGSYGYDTDRAVAQANAAGKRLANAPADQIGG